MIIQIGAILAVVLLYWRRLIDVAKGLVGRSVTGRRTLSVSAIAFVPPGVIAQALEGTIEKHLLAVEGAARPESRPPGPTAASPIDQCNSASAGIYVSVSPTVISKNSSPNGVSALITSRCSVGCSASLRS